MHSLFIFGSATQGKLAARAHIILTKQTLGPQSLQPIVLSSVSRSATRAFRAQRQD